MKLSIVLLLSVLISANVFAKPLLEPFTNLIIDIDDETLNQGKVENLLKPVLQLEKKYTFENLEILFFSDSFEKVLEQVRFRVLAPEISLNRSFLDITALEMQGKTYDDLPMIALLFSRADKTVLFVDFRNNRENFEEFISAMTSFLGFDDIAGHPLLADIEQSVKAGVFQGNPTDKKEIRKFRPDDSINRAELMKILVTSLPLEMTIESWYQSWKKRGFRRTFVAFKDIDFDAWYAPYVLYAQEQDWVNGYPDGSFRPGNSVNLAEASKMILKSRGLTVPPDPEIWFRPFLQFFQQKNILTQKENGWQIIGENKTLLPHYPATRAELAAMIIRLK